MVESWSKDRVDEIYCFKILHYDFLCLALIGPTPKKSSRVIRYEPFLLSEQHDNFNKERRKLRVRLPLQTVFF